MGSNRGFRLMLAGSSVSMLGSRLTTIAYPMLVLYLTGSPFAAGWVAFAATAPSFFIYMPAGALVDRWDPRRTMLVCEFGRGIAIAAVVAALVLGRATIPLLVGAAVAEGVLEVFSTLSEPRYMRSLVERDQTSSALASIEARTHVAVLAGRPLGGFLFGLSPVLPFLADAISFVVSVGALISIKGSGMVERTLLLRGGNIIGRSFGGIRVNHPGCTMFSYRARILAGQLRSDTRAGLRWLHDDRPACRALVLSAGWTLIFQALMIIFLVDAHAHLLPSAVIGMVLAASGVGGALGAMVAQGLRARAKYPWIHIQAWVWGVVFAFLAVWGSQSFLLMAIAMAILGFSGALGNIELSTYLIENVAGDMLGRATSLGCLMSFAACAAGPVLGGLLIQSYGGQSAVFALFGLAAILALIAALTPSSWTQRNCAIGTQGPSMPESPVPASQS